MDIAELGAQFKEATTEGQFEMLDPFGGKTDLVLAIAGPYSYARREARFKYQDALRELQGNYSRPKHVAANDLEKIEDEYLAAHVVGWHGLTNEGSPVVRTDQEALVLLRRAPWLRAQVHKIVNDEKAFLQHIQKKTPLK